MLDKLKFLAFFALLSATGVCHAQTTLSFQEFLNQVGKSNLAYLAEKYNVSIAEAEVIAQKILPDPNWEFKASEEKFKFGLTYTPDLEQRNARVRQAKSVTELKKLALEYWNKY